MMMPPAGGYPAYLNQNTRNAPASRFGGLSGNQAGGSLFAAESSRLSARIRNADGISALDAVHQEAYFRDAESGITGFMVRDMVSLTTSDTISEANRIMVERVVFEIHQRVDGEGVADAREDPTAPGVITPEETADYIVSAATGFLSSYMENHPDAEGEGMINGFLDLIKGGIEEGFRQARGILSSMDVLNGGVAAGVDQTYELIMEKLETFRMESLQNLMGKDPEAPDLAQDMEPDEVEMPV